MNGRAPGLRLAALCAMAAAVASAPAFAAGTGEWNPHSLQPDLTIEDAQLAPANPSRLRVRVANRGLAPAVETQITLVYHRNGKATAMVAAVPLLQTGERQWLIVEIGAPLAEADQISLRIDEPPAVTESDETNNTYVWGSAN
jgi:subtilase family serine protease